MRKIYLLLTFSAMMVVIVNAPMMALGSEILDCDEVIVIVDNDQELPVSFEAPTLEMKISPHAEDRYILERLTDIELANYDIDVSDPRLSHSIDRADLQYRWYKEPDGVKDYNISHARSNC